jgi:hypothetical protein
MVHFAASRPGIKMGQELGQVRTHEESTNVSVRAVRLASLPVKRANKESRSRETIAKKCAQGRW